MAVINQTVTDKYAIYNGDCVEVMQKTSRRINPPFGIFAAVRGRVWGARFLTIHRPIGILATPQPTRTFLSSIHLQ